MMKNEKWSYLENLQVVLVQPYHKQTLAYFELLPKILKSFPEDSL